MMVLFEKAIGPTQVTMYVGFEAPPAAQASTVWLRRVELVNTACGEQAVPRAHLMLLQGPSQTASVKLSYGSNSADLATTVVANSVATVQLPPVTLSCSAPNGIAGLGYQFNGAIPRSGTVEASEVSYGL